MTTKKLVAVTRVVHGASGGESREYEPGETLDTKDFSEKELRALYDAGAVKIDDNSSNEEVEDSASSNEETPAATATSDGQSPPAKVENPDPNRTADVKSATPAKKATGGTSK
ncbi:MAG: hypothetical protein ABW007_27510 [Chitinophagaceae bacterium]